MIIAHKLGDSPMLYELEGLEHPQQIHGYIYIYIYISTRHFCLSATGSPTPVSAEGIEQPGFGQELQRPSSSRFWGLLNASLSHCRFVLVSDGLHLRFKATRVQDRGLKHARNHRGFLLASLGPC